MALRTYADFMRAVREGRHLQSFYRRNAAASASAGQWADLSYVSGSPRINAYAGNQLESTLLNGNNGLWHGPDKAAYGMEKYFFSLSVLGNATASAFPAQMMLADYLMFYPLVDLDDVTTQPLDNVVTLPRYADGEGVRATLVLTLSAGTAANATVTISYTNQSGVSGRTGTATLSASPASPPAGIILPGHLGQASTRPGTGLFFSLDTGDYGVRSVESVTLSATFGGFAALLLVKPLVSFYCAPPSGCRRLDFLHEGLPIRIYDGAYLNLLTQPNGGSVAGVFTGDLQTVWG